jgi:isocitrate dehydrogenase
MPEPLKIIVLEGDETGQELLVQACRVLDAEVLSLPQLELESYDLSLEKRRETDNAVVHDAARAMRELRLHLDGTEHILSGLMPAGA